MDEEDESSPIILIIAAVVALLVGVAISLVLCLLVPDKITMAISIGLILVGITGDIVIIIHNIIASKRKEEIKKRKVGGDCLYSLSVVIFSRSCTRGIHSHRRFYKSDPEWIKFLKKVSKSLSFLRKNGRLLFIFIF